MKMRLILFVAAGAGALACAFAGLVPLAGHFLDEALYRYPGSVLVEAEQLDFSDLHRGWITWRAFYQANTDLATAAQWYAALLPDARTHSVGNCVTLEESWAILHSRRNVAVLLCSLPPGTRIIVNEEAYLSP